MIKVQETTKWDAPNYVYYLSECKTRCFGYEVNGIVSMFVKPMKFDKRYRSFKKI